MTAPNTEPKNHPPVEPAGYKLKDWCAAIPCCRGQYYNLKRQYPDLIEEVKLGSAVIILTSPLDFLRAYAVRRQEEERQAAERQAAERQAATAATEVAPPTKRGRGRPRKYAPPLPTSPHNR